MTKIAHLADVHIRGLRYLDEMEHTFEELYKSLTVEEVDMIVVAGDIYHSKLTVTSEFFDCCSRFFKNLTDIAPTVVILGNHDLALNNPNRMDALFPVIQALGQTKNPLWLEPSRYKINNIWFHTLSILDKKEYWPNQDYIIQGLTNKGSYKEDDVHVALYHGSINNSVVDTGWVSRGNKDDIDIFAGFDYGMLGDIHKYQMLTPRIGYPGSLRQNNFGEDQEKGYLVWNIESKEEYSVKRIILPQKRHFYTITLDGADDIPEDLDIKPDCRIRVILTQRVNISDDIKIRETVKRIYKPCNDVTTKPPDDVIELGDLQIGQDVIAQENLRNIEVQRKLIADFYKDEKLDEGMFEALYRIDEKYNSYLDHNAARNVIWKMKKWKWENIFSYGKGNQIDFSKINGLVGVFGKNTVGKALSLKTEIPTLNGWKTMKEIKVGDFVFSIDGIPTRVCAKSEVFNNRVCYKVIFSDGMEVVADADHLWTVEDHFSRAKNMNVYQTLTTRQLKKNFIWRVANDKKGNGHEWSVDVCAPVKYENSQRLTIPPYVLGCWLGDGTSSSGGFTCGDEEIIQNLRNLGENVVKHNCKKDNIRYNIKKLIPRLRDFNLLNNKHIPENYLQASVQDRKELLAGLLDTDGHCSKQRGAVEFSNINKVLAEQVCELACSLGYKATTKEGDATLYGRFISKKYRVCFTPKEEVFFLERKNDQIKIERNKKKIYN